GLPVLSIRETLPHRSAENPALTKQNPKDPDPYTRRGWVGAPEKPGPYRDHAAIMLRNPLPQKPRQSSIFGLLDSLGEEVCSLPMTKISHEHAQRAYLRLLVCRACVSRAKLEGLDDLLECPEDRLSASQS